ncbi:hypothetical protein QFZ88_004110 [Mesorhizobium sp. YL-MeA3-2017]|jgi:hypothetical protein|nr:hypothetical protein [Mesorhizobium sp. YL-MeA3-2017]
MQIDDQRPRSGPLPGKPLATSDKITAWRIVVVGHD